jgi:3-oxoadipate enol-lactonase
MVVSVPVGSIFTVRNQTKETAVPEISRNGVRIYFDDVGSGPPVVLGHSLLCSGEMWGPQVPVLAERYRVINVDQRGHGRSGHLSESFDLYDMVDDVVAVLDELGIDHAVWAGLSIGGMVAMRAAVTVPDRVSGLILVDTHAGAETGYKKIKYRAMGAGARLLGTRPFLPAIVPLMFGPTTRRLKSDLVDDWRERFASVHLPSLNLTVDAVSRRDTVIDKIGEIRMPTLVIVGDEDASLPVACSREIAAAIPGATLVIVPGAGHLSSLEQPGAVTEAMMTFLEEVHATQ